MGGVGEIFARCTSGVTHVGYMGCALRRYSPGTRDASAMLGHSTRNPAPHARAHPPAARRTLHDAYWFPTYIVTVLKGSI